MTPEAACQFPESLEKQVFGWSERGTMCSESTFSSRQHAPDGTEQQVAQTQPPLKHLATQDASRSTTCPTCTWTPAPATRNRVRDRRNQHKNGVGGARAPGCTCAARGRQGPRGAAGCSEGSSGDARGAWQRRREGEGRSRARLTRPQSAAEQSAGQVASTAAKLTSERLLRRGAGRGAGRGHDGSARALCRQLAGRQAAAPRAGATREHKTSLPVRQVSSPVAQDRLGALGGIAARTSAQLTCPPWSCLPVPTPGFP